MNILALDIGMRRTGVAFADADTGVPLALNTLQHTTTEELISAVKLLLSERTIDLVVCGLPLLPSGEEGAQCAYVHAVAEKLSGLGVQVSLLDERYTTIESKEIDGDASAACQLLLTFLEREKRST